MSQNKYEHGGKVWDGVPDRWMDFSANINPLGCPSVIRDEIKKAVQYIGYYPDADMKSATRNIADYLGVDKSCVLPTNGGISALHHIVQTAKPQRVIILAPCFVEYRHIAEVGNAKVVVLPLLNGRHSVELPIDDIKSVARAGDMLIICNPVNPIGHAFSKDEIINCIEIMNSCGGYIVIDEAFIDYRPENTMTSYIEDNDRLIIAGSLTKMFAIPGVRLGYICAKNNTIDSMKSVQMPWVLSCFASAATNGLKDINEFVERSIESNNVNRRALKKRLEELGVYVFDSCANFLFADLKDVGVTAKRLAMRLREENILIRDCSNYDMIDECYARFAVKSKHDNDSLLKAIKGVLDDKG